MKVGLLFPGQGSQTLGMGKDLYDNFEDYRKVYEEVLKITGIDISKITFENEELLNQTKYTQLAILTMSLAILNIIDKNINLKEDYLAGLSLGEYSALVRSGYLSFEDGIRIVSLRGKFMQEMCPDGKWSMAAVMGTDEKSVNEICSTISYFVKPANFNTIGQIVVSGEEEGIDEFITKGKENGIRKILKLNTSGPFHTEKLIEASNALREELEKIEIKKLEKNVVKNLDGKIYKTEDNIKEILQKHIISPVRFEDTLNTMFENGVDTFVEIGPGKTLTGFVKRINKDVNVFNVNDVQSLENFLTFMKNGGKINE